MDRDAVMSLFLIVTIETGLDHLTIVWGLAAKKCEPLQAVKITEAQTQTSFHSSTAPLSVTPTSLEIQTSSSRHQSGSRAPQTIKQRQATSKPVATRYSPPFGNSFLKQRTESDPTVLLNSTHS